MYVPTVGPAGAKIFFVGEAPGSDENRTGRPFEGYAGRTFNQLLQWAGINRAECLVGNVAREQPPGNKISFFFEDDKCTRPKDCMLVWIDQLKKEIEMHRPNIVVAMGRTALWALTGLHAISQFRGYVTNSTLVPGVKVLPTYHPQAVNYEWPLHFQVLMDLRKAKFHSTFPTIPADARRLHASPSKREFINYLDYLCYEHEGPVACDIETVPMKGNIYPHIFGFADSASSAYSFQLYGTGGNSMYDADSELEIMTAISRVCEKKQIITHNGTGYDAAAIFHVFRIKLNCWFDTMIATHVCMPEVPRSLAFLSSICLDVPSWKHTAKDQPTLYNAADAANTFGCYEYLSKELTKQNLWNLFNFEMSQWEPSTLMHLKGMNIDVPRQLKMKEDLSTELDQLETELANDIGRKVNFKSPKQLNSLLYVDMKLPIQYKRRTSATQPKQATTNAEALNKLFRDTQNPIIAKILRHRKLSKLLNTFIDIEISPNNTVHTSYNITGATMARGSKGGVVDDEDSYRSFGRWSSSESIILPYGSGNLQNIPSKARVIYTPRKGHVLIQADYVQAEAVAVAFLIGDFKLISMFRESFGMSGQERKDAGYDVHRITASQMFNVNLEDITKEMRTVGKTLRHATNYSAGPSVVAVRLGCTQKEAKELLRMYHNATPQLHMWHLRIQDQLRSTRTLTNLLGRPHRFLERWGDDLFRSAYSYIPQSTVGDLLNRSLCSVYYNTELELCLQLHDAMYVSCPPDEVEKTMQIMYENMITPLTANGMKFYIDVDFKVGPSWGEMEEMLTFKPDLSFLTPATCEQ